MNITIIEKKKDGNFLKVVAKQDKTVEVWLPLGSSKKDIEWACKNAFK